MPNQQQIQQVIQQAQRLANELRSLANQSPDRVSRDSLTEGAHHLEMCVRECEHTSQVVQQGIMSGTFGTATYGQQYGTTFGQQQPYTPTVGVTGTGYGTGQQYGGYGTTTGQQPFTPTVGVTGTGYGTGQQYGGYGTTTGQQYGGYGTTTGQQYGGYGQTGQQYGTTTGYQGYQTQR